MTKYSKERPMRVLSLGMGQQSVVLYLMSSMGLIARADYAIFSDTLSESAETYKYLDWLVQWSQRNNGIPIICTGKGNLYNDIRFGTGKTKTTQRLGKLQQTMVKGVNYLLNPMLGVTVQQAKATRHFTTIPAFTRSPKGKVGMLRRQCTGDYKITEVDKAIRSLHGLAPRQRTPPTEIWMGITSDEIERMRYPRVGWQTFVYPFCNTVSWKDDFRRGDFDITFRRSDCVTWLVDNEFPVPPKSACFFCPYQSDSRWLDMKKNRPEEWKQSVILDNAMRNSTKAGVKYPVFLHHSAVPLEEADLQENQLDLFTTECHGVCGV